MNQEYEELLFRCCPSIYKNREKTGMAYGFCFGNGWFNLILDLSLKLEKMNKTIKDKGYIYQSKEKFGYLCIYAGNTTKDMDELIRKYEHMSGKICEECSAKKKVKTSGPGWVRTLCDDCRNAYT